MRLPLIADFQGRQPRGATKSGTLMAFRNRSCDTQKAGREEAVLTGQPGLMRGWGEASSLEPVCLLAVQP